MDLVVNSIFSSNNSEIYERNQFYANCVSVHVLRSRAVSVSLKVFFIFGQFRREENFRYLSILELNFTCSTVRYHTPHPLPVYQFRYLL
jgi:hypothetical protein